MIKPGKNKVTLTMACFFSAPSVFCSMELITLQELRRAPTTFLKATDSKFLSSLESSTPVSVTAFIEAAMSSYLGNVFSFKTQKKCDSFHRAVYCTH